MAKQDKDPPAKDDAGATPGDDLGKIVLELQQMHGALDEFRKELAAQRGEIATLHDRLSATTCGHVVVQAVDTACDPPDVADSVDLLGEPIEVPCGPAVAPDGPTADERITQLYEQVCAVPTANALPTFFRDAEAVLLQIRPDDSPDEGQVARLAAATAAALEAVARKVDVVPVSRRREVARWALEVDGLFESFLGRLGGLLGDDRPRVRISGERVRARASA